MAVLYLEEYGATLRATHERLIVEKDGKELASLHPQELELVVVLANCGFRQRGGATAAGTGH